MNLTLTIDDAQLQAKLASIAQKVGNLRPVLAMAGEIFKERTQERIRNGTDWNGKAFAPNSPTTLLLKRGNQPLVNRGVMRDTIDYKVDGNSVLIQTFALQAATLQFGAKKGEFGKTRRGAPIPWGDIPARPFFPDDESALETATQILMRYLDEEAP